MIAPPARPELSRKKMRRASANREVIDLSGGSAHSTAMFLFGLAGETGGFDPLILLLLALCLEGLVGNFVFPARPGSAILVPLAGLMGWADHKLNRESRSHADRALRGAALVLFFLALALGLGLAVAWASQNLPFAWLVELALLITLIAQRGLFHAARGVGRALHAGDLDGAGDAARRLADTVQEGTEPVDAHGLARRAIASCAGNFSTRVVAPVFYYALFGFPGLLTYRVLSLLALRIGRPEEKYRAFGFTAARMAGVLDLIPSRLAALIIVLAALFVPTARPGPAWKAMRTESAQAFMRGIGWPLGAMGGALDLSMTGPDGPRGAASWVGGGRARATHRDVSRALYIFGVACLLNAVWVGALTIIRFA